MTICIFGAGYVGLPLAYAFSKFYRVYCFDINKNRISKLKKGIDLNNQFGKRKLVNKNLFFIDNLKDIKECNYYIITVPTPIKKNNTPDLSYLESSSKTVSKIIKPGSVVIYESTTYPGCTEEICIPILEKESDLKYNKDFFVGYSPERINPGDKIHTLNNIVKVVGSNNRETTEKIKRLYNKICKKVHIVSSIKIAETSKIIENVQRDVNIALINELSVLFHKLNIPTQKVLEAASTKWNFHYYKPGLVGGHCIGVDPYYLSYKAQTVNYFPQLILAGRRFNESMGRYIAVQSLKLLTKKKINLQKARIAILGFAFKENINDFRNTKVLDIIKELENWKLNIKIFDSFVPPEEVKNIHNLKIYKFKEIKKFKFDLIIIAVAHKEFKKKITFYNNYFKNKRKKIMVDVKNLFEEEEYKKNKYAFFLL
jgi:UDP-N-acetyl-D-galactosamine dehydrogenase